MSKTKRKRASWKNRLHTTQPSNFFGRTAQVALFQQNMVGEQEPYLIFNIYGQGGVGKTTLLRRFVELATAQNYMTVMLDETTTDLLTAMQYLTEQVAAKGHPCAKFSERYKTYVEKKREADKELDKAGIHGYAAGALVKTVLTVGRMAHPAVGEAVNILDEDKLVDYASQLADYARRKLKRDEAELLLDPIGMLTPLWLADLTEIATRQPLLLGFDTYERTGSYLDEWLRELLEERYGELPEEMVWVIAGRDPLDNNQWANYMPIISRLPLEPFTEDEAINYMLERGVENEAVIALILDISQRLPLLLAMLAENAPQTVDDVQEVSSSAVERFLLWVDDPAKRELALHAAVPRLLNQDVVVALLTDKEQAAGHFAWLKTMPFVLERADGWRYHDVVRPQMLRYLRRASRQNLAALHERLSAFYAEQRAALDLALAQAVENNVWQQLTAEEMYHSLSQAPHQRLSTVLGELLQVMDVQRSVSRSWHLLFTQVGQELEDQNLLQWGQLVEHGLPNIAEENYQPRIDFLTACIKQLPQNSVGLSVAYAQRGENWRLLGKYAVAIADFDHAIELNPDYAWAWASRGHTYRTMEQYEQAVADFDRAIELDPDSASTWIRRGATYLRMGEYEQVLADIGRGLQLVPPDLARGGAIRGSIYSLMGDYKQALADFRHALQLDSGLIWVWASRGQTYRTMEQYEQALADFDRAIELNPDYAWAWASRGQTYQEMEQYERALADFDRAIELDPDSAWVWGSRGETYRLIEQYEQSLVDFDRAIELDPDSAWKLGGRGEIRLLLGQYALAQQDIVQAITRDPQDDWPHYWLYMALFSSGKLEEATVALEQAITTVEDQLATETETDEQNRLGFNRALYWLAQGKIRKSEAAYTELLAVNPQRKAIQDAWRDLRDYQAVLGENPTVAAMQNRLQQALAAG